jgi:hypothetical protein
VLCHQCGGGISAQRRHRWWTKATFGVFVHQGGPLQCGLAALPPPFLPPALRRQELGGNATALQRRHLGVAANPRRRRGATALRGATRAARAAIALQWRRVFLRNTRPRRAGAAGTGGGDLSTLVERFRRQGPPNSGGTSCSKTVFLGHYKWPRTHLGSEKN